MKEVFGTKFDCRFCNRELHSTIGQLPGGHKIGNIKKFGNDEISYCEDHKFDTATYDLERSYAVWVSREK